MSTSIKSAALSLHEFHLSIIKILRQSNVHASRSAFSDIASGSETQRPQAVANVSISVPARAGISSRKQMPSARSPDRCACGTSYTSCRIRKGRGRSGRSSCLHDGWCWMPSACGRARDASTRKGSHPTQEDRRANLPSPRPCCSTGSPDRSRSSPVYPHPWCRSGCDSPLRNHRYHRAHL